MENIRALIAKTKMLLDGQQDALVFINKVEKEVIEIQEKLAKCEKRCEEREDAPKS